MRGAAWRCCCSRRRARSRPAAAAAAKRLRQPARRRAPRRPRQRAARRPTTTATVDLPRPDARCSSGQGGYNHATDEGWQTADRSDAAGRHRRWTQIFVGDVLWMKSPSSSAASSRPGSSGSSRHRHGRRRAASTSRRCSADAATCSAAAATRDGRDGRRGDGRRRRDDALPRTRRPEERPEPMGGDETTHDRGDRREGSRSGRSGAHRAVYKPVDVWVDEDGRVRQVQARLHDPGRRRADTPRRGCTLTMKLARLRRDRRRRSRRPRGSSSTPTDMLSRPADGGRGQDLAGRPAVRRARRCASTRSTRPSGLTLLDVLDIVKDRHDGTLAFRKSCRMMICGSCGMRMDGAAVLACKTRMYADRRRRATCR